MFASLFAIICLPKQASPPLYGYKAGSLKFESQIVVGGAEQKTGLKGDGNTVYVVQIDGVANTPAGRSVDGLYTFVDRFASFPIPAKNSRIQLLIGTNNLYRDWEFYKPGGGDAYPAFQQNNSYRFLWKPSQGDEIAVVSPNLKWTNPADDPLAGTFFVKISTAVADNGTPETKSELTAVDCQDFRDNPGDIPVQPSSSQPKQFWVDKMATEGKPLKAVAADGATTVILRAISDKPGNASFSIQGPGGLYPLGSAPFSSAGSAGIQTPLKPLSSGKYVALALYRSPETLAALKESQVGASVKIQPNDGATGPQAQTTIRLVRPPVVLVHGTYDNPNYCWNLHEAEDEAPKTMKAMLEENGFRVFLLDWEETNGMKDPSSFVRNQLTLMQNKGGIGDALLTYRNEGIAVTQADIVCHSQGGVISRVYARGHNLSTPLEPAHPHFNNPEQCAQQGCWYHRANNFSRGDIHRIITISSTHRGSDVCKVFPAFEDFNGKIGRPLMEPGERTLTDLDLRILMLSGFLAYVDTQVSGITTEGFLNQVPGSDALRAIGPTPVPAHAIACVASDEDMKNVRKDTSFPTKGMGNYYGKLYKIFKFTSDEAMLHVIKTIGTAQDYADYKHELDRWNNEYAQLSESGRQYQLDKLIFLIRRIVFESDENDCTVAMKSSFGGLTAPFRFRAPGVLHGWAPRYIIVQQHVLKLLTDSGGLFDRRGFPDSYTGVQSRADTFNIPTLGSPSSAPIPPTNPTSNPGAGTDSPRPGTIRLDDGQLDKNGWTNPEGTSGTAKVENDQLVLDAPTDDFGVRSFATAPLVGDFDLVLDYKLDKWNPGARSSPSFDIYLSAAPELGSNFIQVSRAALDENEEMVFASMGDAAKPAAKGKSGKLRVARKGSSWTVWQWNGSAWDAVGSFVQQMPQQVYLGFGVVPNGEAAVRVLARPRNFSGG